MSQRGRALKLGKIPSRRIQQAVTITTLGTIADELQGEAI
jgi:hypothetical protein